MMNEQIFLPFVGNDKTISLLAVEPFYFTGSHIKLLLPLTGFCYSLRIIQEFVREGIGLSLNRQYKLRSGAKKVKYNIHIY